VCCASIALFLMELNTLSKLRGVPLRLRIRGEAPCATNHSVIAACGIGHLLLAHASLHTFGIESEPRLSSGDFMAQKRRQGIVP